MSRRARTNREGTFLEQLLHPLVRAKILKEYEKAKQTNYSIFLAEIPLLYESGLQDDYDKTIVINSPLQHCLRRFLGQGGTEENFYKRLSRHLPMETKQDLADFILDNSGSLEDLQNQVSHLYKKIVSRDT